VDSTTLASSTHARGRVSGQRLLAALAAILSAAVILAHAVLIAGGGWGGDEYFNFFLYRQHGLQWLFARMLQWSPRPSSDGVLYLYALAVNHWHAPLITPFLAILWLILIAGTLAATWQRGGAGWFARLAMASTALAMFWLGHRINDLFYWPMGATPYVLDLTGIAVVTMQVVAGGTQWRGGRWACGLALAVAATSSETGLFFAALFTAALFVLDAPELLRSRVADLGTRGWYLLPLLVSAATAMLLLYIVAHNPSRGIDPGSPYFHHLGASLSATLTALPADVLGGDGSPSGMGGPAWLLTYCLLAVGFLWACRVGLPEQARRQELAALSVGLIGCYLLTLFTTYYEYSQRVHEPETAFRRCLVILIVLVAARIGSSIWPMRRGLPGSVGPLALCAALCVGMIARAPGLYADYQLVPQVRRARDLTWDSGKNRASPVLHFYLHPQGEVVNELIPMHVGTVILGASGNTWWTDGLMQFFDKRALEIQPIPPGQTR
jgi:hypothetical protein